MKMAVIGQYWGPSTSLAGCELAFRYPLVAAASPIHQKRQVFFILYKLIKPVLLLDEELYIYDFGDKNVWQQNP
jgi:hypothetical protein